MALINNADKNEKNRNFNFSPVTLVYDEFENEYQFYFYNLSSIKRFVLYTAFIGKKFYIIASRDIARHASFTSVKYLVNVCIRLKRIVRFNLCVLNSRADCRATRNYFT